MFTEADHEKSTLLLVYKKSLKPSLFKSPTATSPCSSAIVGVSKYSVF
jgi:hypothetical protein